MASTPVTRATLKTRIAQRANTSGYVDASVGGELSQLVDTSLGKLHNLIVELYEDYYMKRFSFAMIVNQSYYALPTDFMKIRAVFYLIPSTSAPADLSQATGMPLRRIDPTEELQTWGATMTQIPYGYIIEDAKILIVPAQSVASNYIGLRYIPQYVPVLNDSTPIEFAIAFGWDEWVVNDVTIQIRNKAMMPAQELVAERKLFEDRVRLQAKNRNASEPYHVRDTGWKYGQRIAPWGQFSITR